MERRARRHGRLVRRRSLDALTSSAVAQFDVHANSGARRTDVPYVVLVQSALFDSYRRRVVVPLVRVGVLPAGIQSAGSRMHPVFDIHGQRVVLQPLDTVSVDASALGEPVASLAEQGQVITDALDELFTRAWG